MTMSPTPFLYDINSGGAIPPEKRAYFEDRLRSRLYDLVLREFKKQQQKSGLTQKHVASRLGKRPEQINRWLSGPGNWTLDTVSNLLLAICKGELDIGVSVLSDQPARNRREPDWLTARASETRLTETTASHSSFKAVLTQPDRLNTGMFFQKRGQLVSTEALNTGNISFVKIESSKHV